MAAEDAILTTGFRIRAERHELDGDTVKLYTRDGQIQIPAATVRGFEKVESTGFAPNPAGPVGEHAHNGLASAPYTQRVPEGLPPRLCGLCASTPARAASPVAMAPLNPPPPAPVPPKQLVQEAAERHGIPPAFLHSVAQTESAYQANAVSPKGAIGIMQLMPGTAAELKADPHNPAENVEAGARHLAALLEKYEGSSAKALAAYNAGEGAVAKYGGVPPYSETQLYVRKVIDNYKRLSGQAQAAPAKPNAR